MRIALIARLGRRPEMRQIADRLEAMGYVMCSRWVRSDDEDENLDDRGKREAAVKNAHDLESADLAIAFTERWPFPRGSERGGRHADFGYAMAVCKRVIVVGPRENIAYCRNKVEQVDSVAEMMALVKSR